MKKLFIIFLLINLWSCSNTKSTWDCPILGAGNGNCRSIKMADFNHQIIENKSDFLQLPAKINIKLIAPKFEDVKKLQIENKDEKNYAKSNLEKEYAEKRLTEAEQKKLASYGIKFTNGKTRAITNSDQLKAELNILIGSIILGQMADEKWATDSNGSLRLDRMIAVYNAGAYGDTGKKARLGEYATPYDLSKAVNPTTSAYINKILGKDGAMDILTSDLADKL